MRIFLVLFSVFQLTLAIKHQVQHISFINIAANELKV